MAILREEKQNYFCNSVYFPFMKFSSCITNPKIFSESFEKILDSFVAAGFDGIDIPADPAQYPVQLVKDVYSSYEDKLEIPEITAMINPDRDLINPDDIKRKNSVKYIKTCIDIASELDVGLTHFCFITNYENLTQTSAKTLRKRAIESIKEIASYSEENGVKLLMEPLFSDDCTLIKTSKQAVDLWIDALNLDYEVFMDGETNFGLLQDIFHMHHEEKDIIQAIEDFVKITYHRHVADHPRGLDFSREDGGFVEKALKKIDELNYKGYISFESFNPNYGLNSLESSLKSLKSLL